MAHFVVDEAVLARLEVFVQAVLHVDDVLILRGPLAVVLAAAGTSLLRIWILKYLSDVHLLWWWWGRNICVKSLTIRQQTS